MKYEIDNWSTFAHIIADVELMVLRDSHDKSKLELLQLFSQYLNQIINENKKK
jgi:hypothetical protein